MPNAGENALADFEPLTRRVYEVFGRMPVPGDQHLCEYLPWLSDPVTKPWEKFGINLYDWDALEQRREDRRGEIAQMAAGERPIDELRCRQTARAPWRSSRAWPGRFRTITWPSTCPTGARSRICPQAPSSRRPAS